MRAEARWTIQCAWCWRLKAPDGSPVGTPLPKQAHLSHGICRECAERIIREVEQWRSA